MSSRSLSSSGPSAVDPLHMDQAVSSSSDAAPLVARIKSRAGSSFSDLEGQQDDDEDLKGQQDDDENLEGKQDDDEDLEGQQQHKQRELEQQLDEDEDVEECRDRS
jgi:hypothetical protein